MSITLTAVVTYFAILLAFVAIALTLYFGFRAIKLI